MSQHISGNVGQNVSFDLGDMIQICDLRVRKDQIHSYLPKTLESEPGKKIHVLFVGWTHGNANFNIAFDTFEEANKEALRLDWLFKGDKK